MTRLPVFAMPRFSTLSLLRHLFSTLKFKIVALSVLVAIVSVAVTTHFVLAASQASHQQLLLQRSADDVERTASLLTSKLDLLLMALGGAARHVNAPLLDDPDAAQRFLLEQRALGALFTSLFLATPEGHVVARIEGGRPTAAAAIGDREYFQHVLRTGQPTLSGPIVGRITGEPVIVFAVPAKTGRGAVRAVLAGSVGLGAGALLAFDRGSATDGSHEFVFDRNGRVLSHPNRDRVLGLASEEPGLGAEFERWQHDGRPIRLQGSAMLSEGHVVSMAGTPTGEWMVTRLVPEQQALRPLAVAGATAWRVGAIVAVLAALAAAVLAWRLARPITQLQARARSLLDEGQPSQFDWPAARGEIGALSQAFAHVIAQRQRRQRETQRLLTQLQAVLDNAQVGIAFTRHGRFELVSRHFCDIFGFDKSEVQGHSTRILYASEEVWRQLADAARPRLKQDDGFDEKVELVRRSGQAFRAHVRGRSLVPGDRGAGVIWIVEDVTQEFEQHQRLSWRAHHDTLTGLANRALFEALLAQAVPLRHEQTFCALFIDLDRFKQVNDSGGHAAGDTLLRELAQRLAAAVRQSDTVARLGGDEFAVLLPQCPLPQAQQIAEKLRAAVEAYTLHWNGQSLTVGASIGLVLVDPSLDSAAAVLRAADIACYEAKRVGRNRVAVYAGDSSAEAAPLREDR